MKCPECNEAFRAALGVDNICPLCGALVSAPCSAVDELRKELSDQLEEEMAREGLKKQNSPVLAPDEGGS